jgi:hypothetical protein
MHHDNTRPSTRMRARARFLILICAALLLSPSRGMSAEQRASDASTLIEAAEIVLAQKAATEAFGDRCAQGSADQKRYVKAAVFFWLSENGDSVYAASQVEAKAHSRSQRSPEFPESSGACAPFAKSIFEGQQNVRHIAPRAFEFLGNYLAAHPMPETEWAERETRVGCIKGGLNKGQDFDGLSAHCECVAKAFVETTTAAERQAYWTAIKDKNDTGAAKLRGPFLPKMLRKCPMP